MKKLLRWLIRIPFYFLIFQVFVRLLRRFYKFPAPKFLVRLIDYRWQNQAFLEETLYRSGFQPGMRVLEVGPGGGSFTLAIARRVAPEGHVSAVDIEPDLIRRLQERAEVESVKNLDARVASVHNLPYPDASFDAVSLITVIGEIPQPERMVAELHRVLKPGGTIVISEMLPDPDYSRDVTILKLVAPVGFQVVRKYGNAFYYTLVFEKE